MMFDCAHCHDRHHVNDLCATGPMSKAFTVRSYSMPRAPLHNEAALKDSATVHINMLRGGIAKPTPTAIGHLYRGEEAVEVVAEVMRQNPDAFSLHNEAEQGLRWRSMAEPRPYPGAVVDLWVEGPDKESDTAHFRVPDCWEYAPGCWAKGHGGPFGPDDLRAKPLMWMLPSSHADAERALARISQHPVRTEP